MATDRKTIGLTPHARTVIAQMMESGYFQDQIDAAKFALAIAVREGIGPGITEGTDTVWNVGSLDAEGELRQLIPVLFEDVEGPYRVVEHLINQGLEIIGREIEDRGAFDIQHLLVVPA